MMARAFFLFYLSSRSRLGSIMTTTLLRRSILLLFISCLSLVASQHIYSPHPCRSALLAHHQKPPVDGTSNHTRRHPDLEVLGFVTPWNPQGFSLVEQYRGRFDQVVPVWYTVKPPSKTGAAPESGGDRDENAVKYGVEGGPASQEDLDWVKRLQKPVKDEMTGQHLAPVKVLPRFLLENWQAEDFKALILDFQEGVAFTEAIMAEVMINGYDGIVLETAGIWALKEPIELLTSRLHQEGKILVIVLPSIRDGSPEAEEASRIVLSAVKLLTPIVDRFHVMTYDYYGPNGALFEPKDPVPEDSRLNHPGVRTPGPNQPFSYMQLNLDTLANEASSSSSSEDDPAFSADRHQQVFANVINETATDNAVLSKLLVGVALYGYSYPIAHVNSMGEPQALPPPLSPLVSKDEDPVEQEKFRLKAQRKEEERGLHPILGSPGSSFTHDDLFFLLHTGGKTLVRRDEASGENIVDYLKPKEDGSTYTGADGVERPVGWYRRAYWPSMNTVKERIELVQKRGGKGIALWEVGQTAPWVLHAL